MATGRRPFEGGTQISTITSILRDTPPLITELRPSLPRHLGRIVKRCLAKQPERRYASAAGLRNDLEALREELDPGAAAGRAGAARVETGRWLAGVLALLIAGTVAVTLVFQGTEEVPPAPAAAIEMSRLTSSGSVRSAAISPDGRYLAHVDLDARGWSLWLTQVSTRSAVEILAASQDRLMSLTFSPDGELLYYLRETPGESIRRLVELPFLGGSERLVNPDVDSGISFSPDGQRFVFMRWMPRESISHLIVGSLDGGEEKVTEMDPSELPHSVAWSPDGGTIALTVVSFQVGVRSHLVVVPLAEPAAKRRLTRESWDAVGRPVWLPDGKSLIFDATDQQEAGGRRLFRASYPSGKVEPVTHDLGYYSDATVSADGSVLAVLQRQSRFRLWRDDPADGREAEPLTSGSGNHGRLGMACAPDGGIVFDSDVGGLHLRRVAADGSGERRLTDNSQGAVWPAVSADGRWLVYATWGEIGNLWKMPAMGGRAERLTDGRAEYFPAIAPNGWVYYLDHNRQELRIARVPLEGGEPEAFGSPGKIWWGQPRISPEGDRLLVTRYDLATSRFGVLVVALADGLTLQQVAFSGAGTLTAFDWAPDGESVTFVVDDRGISNLWNQPLAGGSPRRLTDYDALQVEGFCWAAGGKSLVMSRGQYSSDVVLIRNFG